MRGAFITLEGVEGVGKSTNMAFVTATLRARGLDVVTTRACARAGHRFFSHTACKLRSLRTWM